MHLSYYTYYSYEYTTMLYPDSIMAVGIAAMRPSESEAKIKLSYRTRSLPLLSIMLAAVTNDR